MQEGATSLHIAASGGHQDLVAALIQHGAPVLALDKVRLVAQHAALPDLWVRVLTPRLLVNCVHSTTESRGVWPSLVATLRWQRC